ncbi:MAG: polysaccharide deacetylase family protein [Deltaproteobacteria bacterium]|nr:MAG: polysaccharide deacetylase family protein [Deltaproteobacteria bacterium]
MDKMGKGWSKDKLVAIGLFLIGVAPLFLSSCALIEKKPTKPITFPMIFQSDEYVVCRLKGGESPASLAKRFLGDTKRSWVIEDANEGVPFEKGQMIVIPLKEKNKGGLSAEGYQVVPVLSYHRLAKNCKSSPCTPTHILDQQIRYLKDNGYRVITSRELLHFLRYSRSLPKRSVVITIDDGFRSAYTIAYPILKKYGFTATLFIYTDYIGISKKALTWSQLREMKADGFEVGSHTITHSDLSKKREGEDDQAYIARIERELLVSKQIIDKKLNQNTIYLAFPYGRYNQRVLRICDQVGYKMAFSVKRGGNPFFADSLHLKRDQILKTDMKNFIDSLKTFHKFSLK